MSIIFFRNIHLVKQQCHTHRSKMGWRNGPTGQSWRRRVVYFKMQAQASDTWQKQLIQRSISKTVHQPWQSKMHTKGKNFKEKGIYRSFIVTGSVACAHERKGNKLEPKARKFSCISYCDDSKGYRLINLDNPTKCMKSGDVTFMKICVKDVSNDNNLEYSLIPLQIVSDDH